VRPRTDGGWLGAARLLLAAAALLLAACSMSADDDALPADASGSHPDLAVADARARDAALPDAAGGDAAAPPDLSAGSCTGALLCDDFESYPLAGPPGGMWKLSTNGGAVVVDSAHARSGTHAVHVTTVGGAGSYHQAFMQVSGAPIFPVAGNVVFGRMMIWLTAAPTQTTHWTNIAGSGQVTGQGFSAVSRYGGQYSPRMMANYDTSGVASDCWQHSATGIPVGRWACFEWRFDGPQNEMDFWLDGSSLADLTVLGQGQGCIANGTNGKWLLPEYDTISLGWEHYQASDAIDLWIDDVALDTQRIGCPP
jgi:hypothetical protein